MFSRFRYISILCIHACLVSCDRCDLDEADSTAVADSKGAAKTLERLEGMEVLWKEGTPVELRYRDPLVDFAGMSHDFSQDTLDLVGNLRGLKLLTINSADLDDSDLASLIPLTSLETLELKANNIQGPGLAHLTHLKRLKQLRLGMNNINGQSLPIVARLTSLVELQLAGNPIGDNELRKLGTLQRLENLDLHGTHLTDIGVARIVAALPRLRHFNAGVTFVSDKGLSELGSLKHLRSLDISGAETTIPIPIDRLWLDHEGGIPLSRITGSGVYQLASLDKLETLWLAGTRVRDRHLTSLLEFPSLVAVDLSFTDISEEGIFTLGRHETLKMVFIEGVDLPADAEAKFRKLHPDVALVRGQLSWLEGVYLAEDEKRREMYYRDVPERKSTYYP